MKIRFSALKRMLAGWRNPLERSLLIHDRAEETRAATPERRRSRRAVLGVNCEILRGLIAEASQRKPRSEDTHIPQRAGVGGRSVFRADARVAASPSRIAHLSIIPSMATW